jgi:hypothetical protein
MSAAAVVLAGGGVVTYVAVSASSSSGGAASPRKAIESIVSDLNNDDLVGVLDDLAPGERKAIAQPFLDTVDELKRGNVLRSDTNLNKVGGVDITAGGLTFADKTITINDHVQIVQLTGGTLHLRANASQLPFTSDFLKTVAPNGLPSNNVSESLDIGSVVRETGKPVRIAAQKVGGKWYPSLLYSIADNATTASGLSAPSASDRIPAVGASSADAAVRSFVEALLAGQVQRAAQLLSPDELGVIHDYGKLITDRAHYSAVGVTIKNLTFSDTPIKGGTRVTLKDLDLTTSDGNEVHLTIDGTCLSVTVGGDQKKICVSEGVDQIERLLGETGGKQLTAEERTALEHVLTSITKVGIDASQTSGSWYVNPIRSYSELTTSVLSTLQGRDLLVLLGLVAGS